MKKLILSTLSARGRIGIFGDEDNLLWAQYVREK